MKLLARLIPIGGGRFAFAWFIEAPIAGIEGLPVEEHRRAWRPFIYRKPLEAQS